MYLQPAVQVQISKGLSSGQKTLGVDLLLFHWGCHLRYFNGILCIRLGNRVDYDNEVYLYGYRKNHPAPF